ncbi:MAG TPA: LysR substrate-binding domain-containing protein [Acidimicrobiales bacterium]
MELRQLEYFVAVAEEGSFTRAAERVHVAQPGVSAQVRRLERELGHDLLDRSGRAVRLTDVGAAVLPYARAALDAVACARAAVDEMAGLVRGRVAVGMVTACTFGGLFDLLARFHRAHPGVEVQLSEAASDRLVAAVLEGRLDFALVGLAGRDAAPPGLEVAVVADEALVVAVADGHPWAGRREVAVGELDGEALICLPVGSGLRATLDRACATSGVQPRVALEASSPGVVAELAAEGLGAAVLPESSRGTPGLHVVDLAPETRGQLAYVWRAEGPASPAARALVAEVSRT